MIAERFQGFVDNYNPSDGDCDLCEFKRRLEMCSTCEHRRDGKCLRCRCVGSLLTRWVRKQSKSCPVGRWK